MSTLLLLVIYVAFIGLGIPDSLFGTAWPAIHEELNVMVSLAGCVSVLISGGTIVSSLLSSKLIGRFGTGRVTAVSTSLTAAALLGFSLSENLLQIMFVAVLLGLGAGAVDTALNYYVALYYKAKHMNFLHCFYGIGVSLSPYLMSYALSGNTAAGWADWRSGYRMVFWIQLVIALITIFALPLWNRAGHEAPVSREFGKPDASGKACRALGDSDRLPVRESAGRIRVWKIPGVRVVWLVFIGSCALEYTCGSWGSTFLVQVKEMSAGAAAEIVTLYYAGMAAGRFLSGLLPAKLSGWRLIRIGQGIILIALLLLILPLPDAAVGIGMFCVGLGNGPIFPNLLHLTPVHFGKERSGEVMGTQMAASYLGIMLMPPVFGLLAQNIGAELFPYYLLALLALMTIAGLWMSSLTRCSSGTVS